MAWGTSAGEHFLAANPASVLSTTVAAGGGPTNTWFLPPPRGGSLDDTAAGQAIIDACSAAGGGEVRGWGQYRANWILKQGVVLMGPSALRNPWQSPQFLVQQFAAGYAIDTPVTEIDSCGVIGVGVHGLGPATAGGGIRFQNVLRGFIQKVTCNNFADEGIKVVAGASTVGCIFEDIFIQNCVLNRTRAAVIGALDVDGNDHFFNRIESTISGSIEGHVQSVNLYCCAVVIRGSTHYVDGVIGEISDVGMHILCQSSRFSNCRADKNYGHGWNIFGTNNMFATCHGLSNSQDTTNTYDEFRADSTSGSNVMAACLAYGLNAKIAKYGFEDLVVGPTQTNRYTDCLSLNAVTKQYSSSDSGFVYASGSTKTLTANSATPDVTGYERFITANSAPTTITDFANGTVGQRLIVRCNDANTTIQHNGATIVLIGNGDLKLKSGVVYEFVKANQWLQVGGTYPLGVSADNGDAIKSLQTKLSEETQVWATPLTANRAVTLSTTGVWNGAKFRIVRKASATGASTLDVGTGPLKSLAVGQWCDVEYNGATAAWMLTAFGSL